MGGIFEKKKYGSITLTQPQMVERIIEVFGLNSTSENVKMNDTPACSNNFLENDPYGKHRVQKWNYRSVVGCLRYYNEMVRPDVTMATQQCTML